MKYLWIFVLLLAIPALAQANSSGEAILVQATLPTYPAIARVAHITGKVVVDITVNGGKVVKAEAKSGTHYLVIGALSNLNTWRFDDHVYGTFTITYTYSIAGEETSVPTNPAIEVLPSLDVNITARPVKPTTTY